MMSSGIDLFFVLSAFLLAQQFLRADFLNKERPSLRRYYRTRFLRIAPPYWVVLILTLLLFTPHLIPPSEVYSSQGLVSFVLHALLLQTAWFGSYGSWTIATPFWTLTIEVLFYAVLPWIMPLFYRNRAFWLGVPCALVVTLVWLVLCSWSLGPLVHFVMLNSQRSDASDFAVRYWLSQQIPASAFDFAVGIAMANLVLRRKLDLPHDRRLTSPAAGTVYALLGIGLTLVAMWRLGVPALAHQYYFGTSIVTPDRPATSITSATSCPSPSPMGSLSGASPLEPLLPAVFSLSGLAVFGVLGYSVYLIHMQFLYLFDTFPSIFFTVSPKAHFFKLFFSAGAAVLVCSLGLYLAVERPFIFRSRASTQNPFHEASPRCRQRSVRPTVTAAEAQELVRQASGVVSGWDAGGGWSSRPVTAVEGFTVSCPSCPSEPGPYAATARTRRRSLPCGRMRWLTLARRLQSLAFGPATLVRRLGLSPATGSSTSRIPDHSNGTSSNRSTSTPAPSG